MHKACMTGLTQMYGPPSAAAGIWVLPWFSGDFSDFVFDVCTCFFGLVAHGVIWIVVCNSTWPSLFVSSDVMYDIYIVSQCSCFPRDLEQESYLQCMLSFSYLSWKIRIRWFVYRHWWMTSLNREGWSNVFAVAFYSDPRRLILNWETNIRSAWCTRRDISSLTIPPSWTDVFNHGCNPHMPSTRPSRLERSLTISCPFVVCTTWMWQTTCLKLVCCKLVTLVV